MIIIVSLVLLNEGMLQETKIITLPIYNTEFRIYDTYISGPPFEEKNPPAQDQPTGLPGMRKNSTVRIKVTEDSTRTVGVSKGQINCVGPPLYH